MRPISSIDAEIADTEAKLRALQEEKRQVGRSRNAVLIADFDSGMDIAEISRARRLPYGAVQGVLFRSGRTEGGRTAIKQQLEGLLA